MQRDAAEIVVESFIFLRHGVCDDRRSERRLVGIEDLDGDSHHAPGADVAFIADVGLQSDGHHGRRTSIAVSHSYRHKNPSTAAMITQNFTVPDEFREKLKLTMIQESPQPSATGSENLHTPDTTVPASG
jgi:hypothetical protein